MEKQEIRTLKTKLEVKKEGKSVYMLRNSFSYDKKTGGRNGVNFAYFGVLLGILFLLSFFIKPTGIKFLAKYL